MSVRRDTGIATLTDVGLTGEEARGWRELERLANESRVVERELGPSANEVFGNAEFDAELRAELRAREEARQDKPLSALDVLRGQKD